MIVIDEKAIYMLVSFLLGILLGYCCYMCLCMIFTWLKELHRRRKYERELKKRESLLRFYKGNSCFGDAIATGLHYTVMLANSLINLSRRMPNTHANE